MLNGPVSFHSIHELIGDFLITGSHGTGFFLLLIGVFVVRAAILLRLGYMHLIIGATRFCQVERRIPLCSGLLILVQRARIKYPA